MHSNQNKNNFFVVNSQMILNSIKCIEREKIEIDGKTYCTKANLSSSTSVKMMN